MADDVKALLEQLAQARTNIVLLDDPGLNRRLGSFRGIGPLAVRCSKCTAKFSWWALHPVLPQIEFSSNGPRRRHLWKQSIPRDQLAPQPPAPFDEWSRGPSDGIDSAENVDLEGGSDRWKFTCPSCSATYIYTAARMLEMFVRAAANSPRKAIPAQ